uniref:Uncharacterized protein n=1 Tax=Globodera rostochiensis TaxID=31243 RepID=A0A914HYR7_GLORO
MTETHCRLFFILLLGHHLQRANPQFASHLPNSLVFDLHNRRCSGGSNRRAYLRTEGAQMEEKMSTDLQKIPKGLSLQKCADKCTEMADECRSFEYNSEEMQCTLREGMAQPFGGVLPTKQSFGGRGERHDHAHFQQICLPIDENEQMLCPSPHVFERFSQHILAGQAMEVRSVFGLSECLAICLEEKRQMKTDCRSVMYFYESGSCLLNREHRRSVGEGLFREASGAEMVDYFETVCDDVECPKNAELIWVRTEHFRIDPRREVMLVQIQFELEQCRRICKENRLFGSPFPCKAFVYSAFLGRCQLSAESGIQWDASALGHNQSQNRYSSNGFNDTGGDVQSPMGRVEIGVELNALSTEHYHEKMCIRAIKRKGNSFGKCTKSASFELFPSRALNVSSAENSGEIRLLSVRTVADCLRACLMSSECRSVQFRRDRNECVLSALTQLSHPELFYAAKLVDYYDNLCARGEIGDTKFTLARTLAKMKRAKPLMKWADDESGKEGGQADDESGKEGGQADDESGKEGGQADDESGKEGGQADDESGKEGGQADDESGKEGGQADDESGEKSGETIVAKRKAEAENAARSSFRGHQRTFTVSCDFSKARKNASSRKDNFDKVNILSSSNDSTAKILPDFWLMDKLRLKMALLRDGLPVGTVRLDEELELRWTFANGTRSGGLDISVDFCEAERIGGGPPEPPPLVLFTDGCPEPRAFAAHLIGGSVRPRIDGEGFSTSLRVFRFDGSRRVRIRCVVNICVQKCASVDCSMPNGSKESANRMATRGRRRRDKNGDVSVGVATFGELAQIAEGYHRSRNDAMQSRPAAAIQQKSATISGSYSILDEREEDEEAAKDQTKGRVGIGKSSRRIVGMGADKGDVEDTRTEGNGMEEPPTKEGTKIHNDASGDGNGKADIGRWKGKRDDEQFSSSSVSFARPTAFLAIVALLILAVLQLVHLFRFLHKKYGKNINDEKSPSTEEQLLQLPISSLNTSSSAKSVFRNGEHSSWHKTNAIRAQEMCLNRHWHADDGTQIHFGRGRPLNLNWTNANCEDEAAQRLHQQQRTVFPADPIPPQRMRGKVTEFI